LTVHELITNGDRLVMRFSEHAATPDGTLACWAGIGLYDWNGSKLVSCRVEQDFLGQQRQLESGVPDALEPPHLDPWTTCQAVAPSSDAEAIARSWLQAGSLGAVGAGRIDADPAAAFVPVVAPVSVEVHDLFSAGDRVAFHATVSGTYAGGLDVPVEVGAPASIDAAGILTVDAGAVSAARIVTDRFGTWLRLMS
jgi:hypothetical protein